MKDSELLNDGKWHLVELKWMLGELWLNTDYGLYEKTVPVDSKLQGLYVEQVSVGGLQDPEPKVSIEPFIGCIKVNHYISTDHYHSVIATELNLNIWEMICRIWDWETKRTCGCNQPSRRKSVMVAVQLIHALKTMFAPSMESALIPGTLTPVPASQVISIMTVIIIIIAWMFNQIPAVLIFWGQLINSCFPFLSIFHHKILKYLQSEL